MTSRPAQEDLDEPREAVQVSLLTYERLEKLARVRGCTIEEALEEAIHAFEPELQVWDDRG